MVVAATAALARPSRSSGRTPPASPDSTREGRKPIMDSVNVAIIYYSATGTVHGLAQAAAEGAKKAGAQVRLRKVAETAPAEAISANPAWGQHIQDTAD